MQMRLAFIGENDLPAVEADARFAKEHGFQGIEYNFWEQFKSLTSDTVGKMRAILDRHGVRASALGLWGWNHLSPNPAEREPAHAMLDRAIEYAKLLGADVLITGAGDIPGEPVGRKVGEFLRVFPPFLEKLHNAGIKPAFYAFHGASFLDSIEAHERVWEHLPELKMKFDPANWLYHGDDYLNAVRRYGHKIGYMHIKEHLWLGKELASEPAAGMGDIQWGRIFAFLYEHNYSGWLSVEPHSAIWSRGEMRQKMLLLSRRYLNQFLI